MAKSKKNEDILDSNQTLQTASESEVSDDKIIADLVEEEIPILESKLPIRLEATSSRHVAVHSAPVLEKQTSHVSAVTSSRIPKSFKVTEKPLLLTREELEKFESKDRYLAYLKAGNIIKLFKLVEPITGGEEIADKYKVQYEAIAYKGQTMQRLYRERLDADYKVIEQEHLF